MTFHQYYGLFACLLFYNLFLQIHEYDNRIDEIKSINTKQEETIEKLNSDIQHKESEKETQLNQCN